MRTAIGAILSVMLAAVLITASLFVIFLPYIVVTVVIVVVLRMLGVGI